MRLNVPATTENPLRELDIALGVSAKEADRVMKKIIKSKDEHVIRLAQHMHDEYKAKWRKA